MERTRPVAWAVLGEEDEPLMYIIRNPLRGGTAFAVMSVQPVQGLPVVGYAEELPPEAVRVVCPLQNDEAYEEVAEVVVTSAMDYGYYPDSRGPLFKSSFGE